MAAKSSASILQFKGKLFSNAVQYPMYGMYFPKSDSTAGVLWLRFFNP